MILAAGVAAVAVLAGCSGRSWMVADGAPPAIRQDANPVSDGAAAMKALASGRFAEAAALNAALLVENPENRQAQLSYALAQVGLGRAEQALPRLRALASGEGAPDPDVGLAFALAGQPQEGIAILEQAASRPDASQRTRQNLALALALADSWTNARVIVERDAGRAQATKQLTQWAVLAALPPQDRLASVLGVLPVRTSTALTHVEPPLLPATATVQAEAMTAQAEQIVAVAKEVPAGTPAPAVVVAKPMEQDVQPKGKGWVVQLAAMRQAENLEAGWSSLQARYPNLLSRYTPRMTEGWGWNRLTVGDFSGREEAMAECQTLRRQGIECFVRRLPSESRHQSLQT